MNASSQPKSRAVRASAEISADPLTVWGLISDVEQWGERLPTVTSVRRVGGPTPTAVGSRFAVRQPGLPPARYEVARWEPGRGFAWVARTLGLVSSASHDVTPTGGGCRLDLGFAWTGPLAPLAWAVGRRTGQRYVDTEAATFARLAEASSA